MFPIPRNRQLVTGLLILLGCPILVGCGPGKTKLSGQVLFDGKPLPGGVVIFYPEEAKNNPVSVMLDENGKYEVTVPVGELRISVDNRFLKDPKGGIDPLSGDIKLKKEDRKGVIGGSPTGSPPKGASLGPPKGALDKSTEGKNIPPKSPPKMIGTYGLIPIKYATPDQSELKVTVAGQAQTHNIELSK